MDYDNDEDKYDIMTALVAHKSKLYCLVTTRVLRPSDGADGVGSWELWVVLGVEVTAELTGQVFGRVGLGDWAGGCSQPVGVR